jgi:hypothetical protein
MIFYNETVCGPDHFQNAELFLHHKEHNKIGKAIGQKQKAYGNNIVCAHNNPRFESKLLIACIPDGE